MRNRTKEITISLIGIIVILILLMTWVYPYSPLSLNKSYTYKPDPKVVQGYVEDFKAFKKKHSEKTDGDLTTDRVRYVLEMYEQDWLINESSTKMNEQQLNLILFDIKDTRQLLLNLVIQQDYKKEEKEHLIHSIQTLLALEDSIKNIKDNSMVSRSKLETQFSNTHMNFISSFYVFRSFYELTQKE